MKRLVSTLGFAVLCSSATASAHFNLDAPPPSSPGTDGGKGVPPCGDNPNPGTATPVQGGHPLTVKIEETVQHTGFYRFALAVSSLSELPVDNVVKDAKGNILPPNGMPKGSSASAAYEDPPVFPVLADHMFVHTAAGADTIPFQADIMLPNLDCDSCTLQVIEFMQGHDFNTLASGAPAGGYFYHHCANLKITADPTLPLFTPGVGGGSAGGASSRGGSAGAATATSGSGGAATSGGGASTSTGGVSSGGPGAVGQSSGGAPAGGAAITGAAGAESSADNGGCSCSLGKRTGGLAQLAPLLGLLVLARRRRNARC